MSDLKRYQNPEIFEQLAMEYAVGSLQGRARKRFEALMETHFYLRALVDAYEHQFAHLVELLPETQPADRVWQKIESGIAAKSAEQQVAPPVEHATPWWKRNFFKQSFALGAVIMVLAAVLFLNPMTLTPEATATAYMAVMESENHEPMAVTKITRSDMMISVDMMKQVEVEDNMQLTLWCHPKKGGKPMKMGEIANTGKTRMHISKREWQNLENVDMLSISVEHKNIEVQSPSGEIVLQGKLSTSS